MIQLLSPDEVKSGPTRAAREQQTIARDLATEETRLVNSVNRLREDEREERERIVADVAEFRAKAKVEIGQLDITISARKMEVEQIEERRAEAMKPIEAVRAEAGERNEESKDRATALDKREKKLAEAENGIVSDLEDIDDRKQEQDERDEALAQRDTNLKASEEASGASSRALSDKWAEFHIAVHAKNEELEMREVEVAAADIANDIRAGELDRRNLELNAKETQVTDKYATLLRSQREAEGKPRNTT